MVRPAKKFNQVNTRSDQRVLRANNFLNRFTSFRSGSLTQQGLGPCLSREQGTQIPPKSGIKTTKVQIPEIYHLRLEQGPSGRVWGFCNAPTKSNRTPHRSETNTKCKYGKFINWEMEAFQMGGVTLPPDPKYQYHTQIPQTEGIYHHGAIVLEQAGSDGWCNAPTKGNHWSALCTATKCSPCSGKLQKRSKKWF